MSGLTISKQSWVLMTLDKQPFENIVGKGANAGNQHFLLFPHHFHLYQEQILLFQPSLAPLAQGQRAIFMALCPSCVHPSVCPYLRARHCGVRVGLGLVYI